MSVNGTAASRALIHTGRACRCTCANSAASSIFSTPSPSLRDPRAASPTQVLSRHWKKPMAPAQKSGKSGSRHHRLAPAAISAARMATLRPKLITADINRTRRSRRLMLGAQGMPFTLSALAFERPG